MSGLGKFYKRINDATKNDARFKALMNADEPIRRHGWGIIMIGQLIQHLKYEGDFVFPQIARHHLSNIADASTAAAMMNGIQMGISVAFNRRAVSRPVACAAFALALNTGWEMAEAHFPNRHFDWGDEACHVFSAAAYAALGKKRQADAERPFKDPAPGI